MALSSDVFSKDIVDFVATKYFDRPPQCEAPQYSQILNGPVRLKELLCHPDARFYHSTRAKAYFLVTSFLTAE